MPHIQRGGGESDEDRSNTGTAGRVAADGACQASQGSRQRCGRSHERRAGCVIRRCARHVSTAARALSPATRSTADFAAGKVKAVRAAIEKGEFSVDAEAIADKLLSNAQEILSRSRG